MTCVVLCKIDGIYYLRHIILGINPTDTIESVREKYYKDFDKLHDEFFFCKDNAEIKEILTMHGIKVGKNR